ncbi:MAG TPA: hypothetical protein DF282_09015, partial [Hyphomonas sp.]|nr:hypothetical protein [Hyphomonas sp.]
LFSAVAGVALLANAISARMATREVSSVMAQMNANITPPGGASQAGVGPGEIIEGEVIDRD